MTDVSRSDARGAAPRPVREPLKAAYLIVGDDLPKIEAALKRLKQRIVEESGSDLNISEFEAPDDPGVTVVNAANTMAFARSLPSKEFNSIDSACVGFYTLFWYEDPLTSLGTPKD